jgi:hypothetical protein
LEILVEGMPQRELAFCGVRADCIAVEVAMN